MQLVLISLYCLDWASKCRLWAGFVVVLTHLVSNCTRQTKMCALQVVSDITDRICHHYRQDNYISSMITESFSRCEKSRYSAELLVFKNKDWNVWLQWNKRYSSICEIYLEMQIVTKISLHFIFSCLIIRENW